MAWVWRSLAGLGLAGVLGACAVSTAPEPPWPSASCRALGAALAGPWPEGLQAPADLLPQAGLPESPALARRAGQGIGFACLNPLMRQPLRAPELLQRMASGLPARTAPATDWLHWLACAADIDVPCQGACPAASDNAALRNRVDAVLTGLPEARLRDVLQPLLLALAHAHGVVQDLRVPGGGVEGLLTLLQHSGLLPGPAQPEPEPKLAATALDRLGELLDTADGTALSCAGLNLGAAVQRVVADLRALQVRADLPLVRWQASSPWGRLYIDTGSSDDVHDISDQVLLIDVCGNDRMRLRGNRCRAFGMAVRPASEHGADDGRGQAQRPAAAQAVFLHGPGSSRYHVGPDPACASLGRRHSWQRVSPDGLRHGVGLDLGVPEAPPASVLSH